VRGAPADVVWACVAWAWEDLNLRPLPYQGRGGPTCGPKFYKKYSNRDERRRLEMDAATYAGLRRTWQLLLWVPNPDMRLKAAEVLVDKGGQIAELADMEAGGDARDLMRHHRELWSLTVFADPEVAADEEKVRIILAYLSEELQVAFRDADGVVVP
jgi:hypothetical protein